MQSFIELAPEGYSPEMMELWILKEETLLKIRSTELRVARTKSDIPPLTEMFTRHSDMINNLNNKYTVIISLREYSRIKKDMRNLKKAIQDAADFVKSDETQIKIMKDQIVKFDQTLHMLKNKTNVLIFKKS